MWQGAGRGGGDVTIKMLLSLRHHTWRQGEVRPITRHMTRVTAITQSGDDKINIGDRDDTKLAIAADLAVRLSDFTNFL